MARPTRFRDKWRIRWMDAHGKRQSAVFANRKEAQLALNQHLVMAAEIQQGLRSAPPTSRTFGDLATQWLTFRTSQKRSGKDDPSILRRHLLPAFGALPLADLNLAVVDQLVGRLDQELSPKTVHNILTLLIAMLNYARDLDWIGKVPRIRKPRLRVFAVDYAHLKTPAEIVAFLDAAASEGTGVHALYAAAVFTGMRAGELAGLQWSHVDLERRRIVVERSFAGPTKAGDVRYVPILDAVLPILREWKTVSSSSFVFPNRDGNMLQPSARVFQEVFHRVLARAGLERPGAQRIRFHDLRHTFASHWVMAGGDLYKLQRILGHKSAAMTQRYAHLAPDAFTTDLGRLGAAREPNQSAA